MVDTPQAWTDEELDTLRKGIALGLSSAQISRELLPKRSRNSIIGKLNRDPHLFPAKLALALSPAEKEQRRAAKAGQRVEKRTPPRKPARIVGLIKNDPNHDLFWKDRSFPKSPKINFRDASIPPLAGDFLALELHELERHHCRFPHGDNPFTFCGQNTEHGKPYCAHHAALCYRTVEDRKPMRVAA